VVSNNPSIALALEGFFVAVSRAAAAGVVVAVLALLDSTDQAY
jgi:hypothetical protein